jgi:uncharacterized cupredoxin-like copper-binding protein
MIATALAVLTLAAPAPAPARVQVAADEFNYGEDEHDLRLRRAGGTRIYRIGKVRPGRLGELETRFLPGRFTLWCSLADHRKRGMVATLVVRRA